jgi:hypothetical protein
MEKTNWIAVIQEVWVELWSSKQQKNNLLATV